MVIDSSALLTILLAEPEREIMLAAILDADSRWISAVNAFETGAVIEARRGEAAGRDCDLFLQKAGIEIVSADARQVEVARYAWRKFGKGRHPAALNPGDCFAYALARVKGDVLLAKGSDFPQTDIELFTAGSNSKGEGEQS